MESQIIDREKVKLPYELFEELDLKKVLKITQKNIIKGRHLFFYNTLKAHCLQKQSKLSDLEELMPVILNSYEYMYDLKLFYCISAILQRLCWHNENGELWKSFSKADAQNIEASEQYFFSQVRLLKLNDMQSQSLLLFENNKNKKYAEWSAYSHFLSYLQKNMRVRILDIASLILMKATKNQIFVIDYPFAKLFTLVEYKRENFKETLEYIEKNNEIFKDKLEEGILKAQIHYNAGNIMDMINIYFKLFQNYRFGHIPHKMNQKLYPLHLSAVKILVNDYLPVYYYDFSYKAPFDAEIQQLEDFKESRYVPLLNEEIAPIKQVAILYYSIKNIRRDIEICTVSQKLCDEIRRFSFILEMELKKWVALNGAEYKTNEDSSLYCLILNYIKMFQSKYDVVTDLKNYCRLLGRKAKEGLIKVLTCNIEQVTGAEYNPFSLVKYKDTRLLKLKATYFRFNSLFGMYSQNYISSLKNRIALSENIVMTFIGSNEFEEELAENDREIFDQILLIGVEILMSSKLYDKYSLNPINYYCILMLEYAIEKSPENKHFKLRLMSIYSQLGLSSAFFILWKSFQFSLEDEIENGYLLYEHAINYGHTQEMGYFAEQYKKYERQMDAQIREKTVKLFKNRDYKHFNQFPNDLDTLNQSFMKHVSTYCSLYDNLTKNTDNIKQIQTILKKDFQKLNQLTENTSYCYPFAPYQKKEWGETIEMDEDRDKIRKDEEARFMLEHDEFKMPAYNKKNKISLIGIRHEKILQLLSLIIRCLSNSCEGNSDAITMDIDKMLLLNNEIGVHLFRKNESFISYLRKLTTNDKPLVKKEGMDPAEEEAIEHALEHVFPNRPLRSTDLRKEKMDQLEEDKPISTVAAYLLKKIMDYSYDSQVREEINVIENISKLQSLGNFNYTHDNMKDLHQSFLHQYKLECLNYVLLLYESLLRIILTNSKRERDHINAMNPREESKFENKTVLDPFSLTCIGWKHVERSIEVLNLMIKDLVNKIVPTKIIVRELHTTSGKVLNRDSHYALIERKRRVQKGKKWEYEYFYELEVMDLTTYQKKIDEENEGENTGFGELRQKAKLEESDRESENSDSEELGKSKNVGGGKKQRKLSDYNVEYSDISDEEVVLPEIRVLNSSKTTNTNSNVKSTDPEIERKLKEEREAAEEREMEEKLAQEIKRKQREEQEQRIKAEEDKYYNAPVLENYNLHKHLATVFLLDYPIHFTQIMMTLWLKNIPLSLSFKNIDVNTNTESHIYKENKYISKSRASVKTFCMEIIVNLQTLQSYFMKAQEELNIEDKVAILSNLPQTNKYRKIYGWIEHSEQQQKINERIIKATHNRIKHVLTKITNSIHHFKNIGYTI